MKYEHCTKAFAVEIIEEIIENAKNESAALELIKGFLDNKLTTDDIADEMYQ